MKDMLKLFLFTVCFIFVLGANNDLLNHNPHGLLFIYDLLVQSVGLSVMYIVFIKNKE
jgi:hypothetical protein